jgi:folate-dependent phosphoribosylglycinamide formyltransferase PurN
MSDPMRIAIFAWDVPEANVITSRVLAEYPGQIVGIIKSRRVHRSHSNGAAIKELYRRSGDFFLAKLLELAMLPLASLLPRALARRPRTEPLRRMARSHGLKVHSTNNINSPGMRKLVAEWAPDLLVSIYMNQLFESDLLAMSRLGTINVHPSLLPRHRGMAPYVWAMSAGDSQTGVTVHWIDDEQLDKGDVIAQQATPIFANESAVSLAFRCADIGAQMMVQAIEQIGSGQQPRHRQNHNQGSYHGWPDRSCLQQCKQHGHRYFAIRDMWREMSRAA